MRNFGAHIGRAEVADEVVGINFTELWISLDPDVDYRAKVAQIQGIVDGYPGLTRDLLTYLRERIKEVLTGASATIVVRTSVPNLTQLAATAADVRQALANVEGVADLTVQQLTVVPQVEVRLRPEAAQIAGVTPAQVRDAMATLLRGTKVGEIYEDQKIFDTVVWSVPAVRADLFAIKRLPIDTARRRLCAAGHRRRRDAGADAERDHARRRLAANRRDDERARPRAWERSPRIFKPRWRR